MMIAERPSRHDKSGMPLFSLKKWSVPDELIFKGKTICAKQHDYMTKKSFQILGECEKMLIIRYMSQWCSFLQVSLVFSILILSCLQSNE